MIKAIETVYNGYRFRSRLEARWAVFFDTMEIEYQYEPEGFDLGNGIWYLPDFWLPDLELWIEIKGIKPTEDEHLKMALLAQKSNSNGAIYWSHFSKKEEGYATYFWQSYDIFHSKSMSIKNTLVLSSMESRAGSISKGIGGEFINIVRKAFAAARQARFERGAR